MDKDYQAYDGKVSYGGIVSRESYNGYGPSEPTTKEQSPIDAALFKLGVELEYLGQTADELGVKLLPISTDYTDGMAKAASAPTPPVSRIERTIEQFTSLTQDIRLQLKRNIANVRV